MGGAGGQGGGPQGECGDDVTVIDFNAEATPDGAALAYAGETGTRDVFAASCSGETEGSEAVLRFSAPEAGFWVFSTAGVGFDSILYALGDCNDGFTELACNDDIAQDDLSSRILLELEADETVYLFVDQLRGTSATPFRVTAERIDAEPPVISEFEAFFNPAFSSVGISATATDADGDITRFRFGMIDTEGMPIPLTQASDEFEAGFDEVDFFTLTQNGDGTYTVEGTVVFDALPPVGQLTLALGDANGLWGETATAAVMAPTTERAAGEACDGGRARDLCAAGTACVDRDEDDAFTCEVATAPVLGESSASVNGDEGTVGLHLVGTDAESDVAFVKLTALDAGGAEIPFGAEPGPSSIGFYRLRQAEGAFDGIVSFFAFFQSCLDRAQAQFDECMDDEETCVDAANATLDACNVETAGRIATLRVVTVDDALLESAAVDLAVGPTPAAEAGGICEPLGAIASCPEGTACGDLQGGDVFETCVAPVTACAEVWGAIELTAEGDAFVHTGDSTGAENHGGAGSCGGGGPNVVHRFTAPESGTYHAEVTGIPEDGDSLLFVRSHCGFAGAAFELACNDDIDTQGGELNSAVDFELEAGAEAFLFVDGYDGAFEGPYTLTVTRTDD